MTIHDIRNGIFNILKSGDSELLITDITQIKVYENKNLLFTLGYLDNDEQTNKKKSWW